MAAIGLAGENRVYMASIEHNHASAARGVGVIMGDKRLKAIAVRGTKDLNIAKPAELFEMCQAHAHRRWPRATACGDWMAVDEDDSFHHNHFAWGNARTRSKDYWSDELQERWTKWKYDHMDRQTGLLQLPEEMPQRDQAGRDGRASATSASARTPTTWRPSWSWTSAMKSSASPRSTALDSYSTPQVIAFALELLEAGILTDKDFPDMPADSRGRFFYLLEKIVRREGIGDILADGVSHAAQTDRQRRRSLRPQHHEEIRAAADQAGQG